VSVLCLLSAPTISASHALSANSLGREAGHRPNHRLTVRLDTRYASLRGASLKPLMRDTVSMKPLPIDVLTLLIKAQDETGQPVDHVAEMGVILPVDCIDQLPDLPNGCEITAAAILLNYYGYNVDKLDLDAYLPKTPINIYYENDVAYGPDPHNYFIGATCDGEGWYCTVKPVVIAINNYLAENNPRGGAIDITGTTPDKLYEIVRAGTPVAVWVTIDMREREIDDSWLSEDTGEEITVSASDHTMVLIGIIDDDLLFADPLEGIVTYSKADFETSYESRQAMACILKDYYVYED